VTDGGLLERAAGPSAGSALLDAVGFVLKGGERIGVVALDRFEVLTLLPADVVVQERPDASQERWILGDGAGILLASPGEFAKRAVFLKQTFAERRLPGEGEQEALLVVEVLPDLAAPDLGEGGERGASRVGIGVRCAIQVAGLDESAHVLARQRLQGRVAFEWG